MSSTTPNNNNKKTRIRVSAKRPSPLTDLGIVDILDFNTAFDIDIYAQYDDAPPELYQKVSFIPEQGGGGEPQPPEPPLEDDVLYDSHMNSKLHDGKVRTIEKEGDISPGGLGVECRASGDPVIVCNDDKTFSLKCKEGHGRFYLYCLNYNATLEIECAFWNEVKGQDLSLKMRSRHNEDGAEDNRFGGYGLSIDREGWGAKREPFHNTHDQSTSGDLPFDVKTQEYFTIRHTIKDEGGKVTQIGEMNGKQFMKKADDKPKDYMVDESLYNKQSYMWIRQNLDSGTGEIRIKRLRILKA